MIPTLIQGEVVSYETFPAYNHDFKEIPLNTQPEWIKTYRPKPTVWNYTPTNTDLIEFYKSIQRGPDEYNHELVQTFSSFYYTQNINDLGQAINFSVFVPREQWPILRLAQEQFANYWF